MNDLNAHYATLAKLAHDVASELGAEWSVNTADSHNHGRYLDGPDDVRLFVRVETFGANAGKRVAIHPAAPTFVPHTLTREVADRPPRDITVAASRGARAIARDIERRLIPDVAAWVEQVRARLAEHIGNQDARHGWRDALVAALGNAHADREEDSSGHSRVRFYWRDAGHGSFQINRDGAEAHIELRNMPVAAALEIARVLNETA